MKRKQTGVPSTAVPFVFVPHHVKRGKNVSLAPIRYKVEITTDAGVVDHILAVVGRPFEVKIVPRDGNSGGSSCMVRSRFTLLISTGCIP